MSEGLDCHADVGMFEQFGPNFIVYAFFQSNTTFTEPLICFFILESLKKNRTVILLEPTICAFRIRYRI